MCFRLIYDLDADFKNIMRHATHSVGVSRIGSDQDIEMTLLNTQRKHIAPKPRKVFRSDVINQCPSSLKADLENLLLKVQVGEDLSLHLSRGAREWDYNDGLLNDWGLHHLHFFPKDTRSRDTNYLLFARVTDDKFYAVAIADHREWTNPELIEILKRNWPETVYVINQGATTKEQKEEIRRLNLQQRHLPHEYDQLRRAGISSFIVTEDGSLVMPTLGVNSNGQAVEDALISLELLKTLKFLKQILPEFLPDLLRQAYTLLTGDIPLKMIDISLNFALFQLDEFTFKLTWAEGNITMEVFPYDYHKKDK